MAVGILPLHKRIELATVHDEEVVPLLALRDDILTGVYCVLHHGLLQHRQLHLVEPREDDVATHRPHDARYLLSGLLLPRCDLAGQDACRRLRRLTKAAAAHLAAGRGALSLERELLLTRLPHERMQRHQLQEILLSERGAPHRRLRAACLLVLRVLQKLDVPKVGLPAVLGALGWAARDRDHRAFTHDEELIVARCADLVHRGACRVAHLAARVGEQPKLVVFGELGEDWKQPEKGDPLGALLDDLVAERCIKRAPIHHEQSHLRRGRHDARAARLAGQQRKLTAPRAGGEGADVAPLTRAVRHPHVARAALDQVEIVALVPLPHDDLLLLHLDLCHRVDEASPLLVGVHVIVQQRARWHDLERARRRLELPEIPAAQVRAEA